MKKALIVILLVIATAFTTVTLTSCKSSNQDEPTSTIKHGAQEAC